MEISRDQFEGRMNLCDERFQRDNKRITNLEASMQNLTNLITQLAEIVKTSASSTADQEKRIRDLEQRPAKKFDALWGMVAGALISTVVGLISKIV